MKTQLKKIKIPNIINKIKHLFTKNSSSISNFSTVQVKKEAQEKKIRIYETMSLKEIENLILKNPNSQIIFTFDRIDYTADEKEFYQKLTDIFKILEKHGQTYNIKIKVENRELLKQSGALEHISNINLIIENDLYKYSKEEFLEEEKILEGLIKPIKTSNLSPYEKYLAVYNIVKQFKEYKDNPNNPSESRYLRYILKGEYIVCVGYANLLTTLLDKVGIPSTPVSAVIEEKCYLDIELDIHVFSSHERNIIKIDDDKYNIHGIYIADSTWDNHLKADLYNNASVTFDKIKESSSLEILNDEDLLLDFHNFDEYKEKMNHHLNRKIKKSRKVEYSNKVKEAYYQTYHKILDLLYELDYQKWKYLLNKYDSLIKQKLKDETSTLKDIEIIYSEFLNEYGYYIIELSNNKIDDLTLFLAATNVKKVINGYNEKELKDWETITKVLHKDLEEFSFPYIYNPNEPRLNYLEEKSKTKSRVRTN